MPLTDVDAASGSFVNDNGDTVTFTSSSDEGAYDTSSYGGVTGPWVGNGDANEVHTHTFSEPIAGIVFTFTALSGPQESIAFSIDGVVVDLNTLISSGAATFTPTSGGSFINALGELDATTADGWGTLTINIPITTLGVNNVSPGSDGNGTIYSLQADTAPAPAPDFIVEGSSGDDIIDDTYVGDPEGDRVDDNDHSDGSNDDLIEGYAGDDAIRSGEGNDTIDAGADNDSIDGGAGDDSIDGGTGEDTIIASSGSDTITGGTGTDTYVSEAVASEEGGPDSVTVTSYTFYGVSEWPADEGENLGIDVDAIGDFDGDGITDFLMGAYRWGTGTGEVGAAYVVSGADLAAADAADGTTDGNITTSNIPTQSGSYRITGDAFGAQFGRDVEGIGDIDGDGLDDFMIASAYSSGGGSSAGETYIISAQDLLSAASNGTVNINTVLAQGNSYEIRGEAASDRFGQSLESAGDINGDGITDFLIGGENVSNGGGVSLLSGAELAAADAADGVTDGVIDAENIAAQTDSYSFTGGPGDWAGVSATEVEDFDGDGQVDLLIGARLADNAPNDNAGASYLISSADFAAADAADGVTDGEINLDNIAGLPNSYRFDGVANEQSGFAVHSLGDIDGDGLGDISIRSSQGSYVISSDDYAAADAADGSTDGVVSLSNIEAQANSYLIDGNSSEMEVTNAGDIDGDGLDDFLVVDPRDAGGGSFSGSAYLLSSADLAAADAADGVTDGSIDTANIHDQENSYQILGETSSDRLGSQGGFEALGDVDGDGVGDFLVGSHQYGLSDTQGGATYFLSGSSLADLDAADGNSDGIIDGGEVAGTQTLIDPELTVNVDDAGDGTADTNLNWSNDTLTSVENFVADENTGTDEITLSTTVAFSDRGTITGLDDNSEGTYTPANGDPEVAFGPGEALQLSDLLADSTVDGVIEITAGDEAGQVGNISFENFETIIFTLESALPDFIVSGTTGNDLIDTAYTGDPGGDMVDNNDHSDGSNDDSIEAGAGNDTVLAGDGDDTVQAGEGDDSVEGGIGNDSIFGFEGSDTVDGGDGDDYINTRTSPGTGVPDQGLTYPDDPGTAADETALYSYPSDSDPNNDRDSVLGGAGNDTILTGDDADTIDGGTGADVIDAGFDADIVTGGAGADSIQGSEGADTIDGGDDDDVIYGGLSPLDPNYAASLVYDLEDSGTNTPADPNPLNNADSLLGGAGNDRIYGQDDADTLEGGIGNDTLDGGIDDDSLIGGTGDDELTGGEGNDTFVFGAGDGADTITDFGVGATDADDGDPTNNDFIDLSNFYTDQTEFEADLADDGLANQSTGDFSDNTDMAGGSIAGLTGLSGLSASSLEEQTGIVCFARGTLVETITDPKNPSTATQTPIEALGEGALIVTKDNGAKRLRWIGSCALTAADLAAKPNLRPIRIAAGALGEGLPSRDLLVSPQHRMLVHSKIARRMFGVEEVLVPAHKLLAVKGIDIAHDVETVEYFHILFDRHEVVWANGAPSESLFTGPEALKSVSLEARAEIEALFPHLLDPDFEPIAARLIPEKGKHMKILARRHQKNAQPLVARGTKASKTLVAEYESSTR